MYGDVVDIVGRKRRIVRSKMINGFLPVFTYKVGSRIFSTEPFAVGAVDGNSLYRFVIEQIVGQISTVVSGYFYAVASKIAIGEIVGIGNDDRAPVGSYP